MPKSRNRTNRKPKLKPLSHKDHKNIVEAYYKKRDEFSRLDVPALMELKKSETLKGTYLHALLDEIEMRQQREGGGTITQIL